MMSLLRYTAAFTIFLIGLVALLAEPFAWSNLVFASATFILSGFVWPRGELS